MVNKAAYKGEKRQKEIARQKRQEEKRQRRHARGAGQGSDDDDTTEQADGAPTDAPSPDKA